MSIRAISSYSRLYLVTEVKVNFFTFVSPETWRYLYMKDVSFSSNVRLAGLLASSARVPCWLVNEAAVPASVPCWLGSEAAVPACHAGLAG